MIQQHSLLQVTVIALAVSAVTIVAHGNTLQLPSIFGNHMVLQRDIADPVWGWANPGQRVTVHFAGHVEKTVADGTGRWQVKLPAMKASSHGRNLTVQAGKQILTIHDVLVGEVWLCSGQSNMVFKLPRALGGKQAVAQSNHPDIRMMIVSNKTASSPKKEFSATWEISRPQIAGQFSAVAYFFALNLYQKLHVPIGILNAAWSGTHIQPWIPTSEYHSQPHLDRGLQIIKSYKHQWRQMLVVYTNQMAGWLKKAKRAITQHQVIPDPPKRPRNPVTKNYPNQPVPRYYDYPAVLYNAMVSPMAGYGMRGVVWYQGAGNVNHHPKYYSYQLPALIHGWRTHWKKQGGPGMFSFAIVQIAPWAGYHGPEVKVWAAELHASRHIPKVGIIGTMDIGSQKTVHPRNKKAVGKRLMLWAMAKVYGQKNLVCSGPRFAGMHLQGSKAIIHYTHIGSGLAQRHGQPLNWFEIAGPNGKFVKAKAHIQGNTVVVHAAKVAHPKAVRFAWSKHAVPSLQNKEGLPALPFWTGKVE